MTDGERKLWALLRRKQLAGFRFRRQAGIGPFIADFFCPKSRLIVELDGEPHSDEGRMRRDAARTKLLAAHGSRVIRFCDLDVVQRTNAGFDTDRYALIHTPS